MLGASAPFVPQVLRADHSPPLAALFFSPTLSCGVRGELRQRQSFEVLKHLYGSRGFGKRRFILQFFSFLAG